MGLDYVTFFWISFKAAILASNGMTNLPALREEVLARGWGTDRDFAESFAIGGITPGPNGLWVASLGYLIGGWAGGLVALAATLPAPALVLIVERIYNKYGHHPVMIGFVQGIGLAVVGVQSVVLGRLLIANGLDPVSLLVALGAVGLGVWTRLPIIAVLALAAAIGVAAYR